METSVDKMHRKEEILGKSKSIDASALKKNTTAVSDLGDTI